MNEDERDATSGRVPTSATADCRHVVSVIIPTYNRPGILRECLMAALNQTYDKTQIIVTDDSQNNLVNAVVREVDSEGRIEYRRNSTRLGLPANRNAGLAIAKGDLVVFLDDDSVMEHDCVEKLVYSYADLLIKGVKIGAVGPSLITEGACKQGRFLEHGLRSLNTPSSPPIIRNRFTGIPRMNFSPRHGGVIRVSELHSNSMYARDVLGLVGGYEERLYQGNYLCEETDIHARIKKSGYELYFNPSARIHHKPAESGGCRASTARYGYYYFRNHAIYIVRNYGLRSVYMVPSLSLYMLAFGLVMMMRYSTAKVTHGMGQGRGDER